MRRRIQKLWFPLRRTKGVDIVVTHAPPEGLGDDTDPAHRGFQSLIGLLDKYHPKYLLHGHVHLRYSQEHTRNLEHNGSHIINVCPRYTMELPDRPYDPGDKHRLIWHTKHKD
jgi:Icc-related predicted phosphoesterase